MICRSAIIWCSFMLLMLSACSVKTVPQKYQRAIRDTLAGQQGFFAVAFKDLTTGRTLLINEHESFHAASTMKTPVMIEIFKQVNAGKLSLPDSITVKNEFKSIVDTSAYSLNPNDDSEKELYKLTGTKRTLSSLVYDMIIVSSNLATNTVIAIAGANNVTQTMRSMGAKDIQVLRGVEDNKAFEKGLNNTATAYDLALIFEKIARGEAVSPSASKQMIDILLDQQFNTIIPAQLPKDVKVAHKTGSITGVHHDSGIVFLPDGRKYVLVILSKNLKDDPAATRAMAAVSKLLYDFMMR
jgi:beta-lactamase class A